MTGQPIAAYGAIVLRAIWHPTSSGHRCARVVVYIEGAAPSVSASAQARSAAALNALFGDRTVVVSAPAAGTADGRARPIEQAVLRSFAALAPADQATSGIRAQTAGGTSGPYVGQRNFDVPPTPAGGRPPHAGWRKLWRRRRG